MEIKQVKTMIEKIAGLDMKLKTFETFMLLHTGGIELDNGTITESFGAIDNGRSGVPPTDMQHYTFSWTCEHEYGDIEEYLDSYEFEFWDEPSFRKGWANYQIYRMKEICPTRLCTFLGCFEIDSLVKDGENAEFLKSVPEGAKVIEYWYDPVHNGNLCFNPETERWDRHEEGHILYILKGKLINTIVNGDFFLKRYGKSYAKELAKEAKYFEYFKKER